MSTRFRQASPWEIPALDARVPTQRVVEFLVKLKRSPGALHEAAERVGRHDVNIHKGIHFLTRDKKHIVWVFFADVGRGTDVHSVASTLSVLDCVEEVRVEDGCVDVFLFPPALEGDRWLLLDGATLGKIGGVVRKILGERGGAAMLYKAGYASGWGFCGRVEELLNPASMAEWVSLLERLFPALGWGGVKFEEVNLTRANGIVVCTNLVEAASYFGKRSRSKICHLFQGYLAGVLARIAERPVLVSEVCCQAIGDDSCVFEVKPAARHPVDVVADG